MQGSPPRKSISIHAPRKGERRTNGRASPAQSGIFQSTLPARGSDHARTAARTLTAGFQSTLPARGSDFVLNRLGFFLGISIHAPRKGERPKGFLSWPRPTTDFNPRSPQGGATYYYYDTPIRELISIHAPRKGERRSPPMAYSPRWPFQSTLPARGSDVLPL